MKVAIDFSVFIEDEGVFGNVTGEVDVPIEPQIGDSLSFLFSSGQCKLDVGAGSAGMLKVTDRIVPVNQNDQLLSLALNEVVVPTKSDALNVM